MCVTKAERFFRLHPSIHLLSNLWRIQIYVTHLVKMQRRNFHGNDLLRKMLKLPFDFVIKFCDSVSIPTDTHTSSEQCVRHPRPITEQWKGTTRIVHSVISFLSASVRFNQIQSKSYPTKIINISICADAWRKCMKRLNAHTTFHYAQMTWDKCFTIYWH